MVGHSDIMADAKPPFSDEWVEHNPWMKEANEEALKESPIRLCMFINYPNGIPIPALRKRWAEYEDWQKKEKQRLEIFSDMMSEKSIRAGQTGVGKPIRKGWGHKK